MDIESLYVLADKDLPATFVKVEAAKAGTCSRVVNSNGNIGITSNSLNIKYNNKLFPLVPVVPTVLLNPLKLLGARVGGGGKYSCDENEARGFVLLSKASSENNHPLDDLMDWYSFDMDIIGNMTPDSVSLYISDYISNIDYYRGFNSQDDSVS